jgi:hypothetical protein
MLRQIKLPTYAPWRQFARVAVRVIALVVLILDISWRRVVNFMPQQLYPPCPLKGSLVGSKAGMDRNRTPDRPARSSVTVPITRSRLHVETGHALDFKCPSYTLDTDHKNRHVIQKVTSCHNRRRHMPKDSSLHSHCRENLTISNVRYIILVRIKIRNF